MKLRKAGVGNIRKYARSLGLPPLRPVAGCSSSITVASLGRESVSFILFKSQSIESQCFLPYLCVAMKTPCHKNDCHSERSAKRAAEELHFASLAANPHP